MYFLESTFLGRDVLEVRIEQMNPQEESLTWPAGVEPLGCLLYHHSAVATQVTVGGLLDQVIFIKPSSKAVLRVERASGDHCCRLEALRLKMLGDGDTRPGNGHWRAMTIEDDTVRGRMLRG
jgi:hypothetical protein